MMPSLPCGCAATSLLSQAAAGYRINSLLDHFFIGNDISPYNHRKNGGIFGAVVARSPMRKRPYLSFRHNQQKDRAREREKKKITDRETIFGVLNEHARNAENTWDNQKEHNERESEYRRDIVKAIEDHIRAAKRLNCITGIAGGIAFLSLLAVAMSVWDARNATVEANRAWVAPRTAHLEKQLVIGEHVYFRVTYDNPGKGPALDTEMWWNVSIVDSKSLLKSLDDATLFDSYFGENKACDAGKTNPGGEVIWPSGAPGSYSNSYTPKEKDEPVITQEVLDGGQTILVRGCIHYMTFGTPRHSSFCFWLRQVPPAVLTIQSSAVICPKGNGAT